MFTQSYKPYVPGPAGISECTMSRPAVIHCTSTALIVPHNGEDEVRDHYTVTLILFYTSSFVSRQNHWYQLITSTFHKNFRDQTHTDSSSHLDPPETTVQQTKERHQNSCTSDEITKDVVVDIHSCDIEYPEWCNTQMHENDCVHIHVACSGVLPAVTKPTSPCRIALIL